MRGTGALVERSRRALIDVELVSPTAAEVRASKAVNAAATLRTGAIIGTARAARKRAPRAQLRRAAVFSE